MDSEQARFLLGACQPDGADSSRPEIAEALSQARTDSELAAWLARERRSDAAIAAKLRELEPGPELRARLLAGGRATRRARNWRSWRRGLGLAAAVAVAAGLGWWGHTLVLAPIVTTSGVFAPLQTWQENAVGIFADPFFRLDREDHDYRPLKAHLVDHHASVVNELPFTDAVVSAIGCKILDWQGTTMSLTCFRSDTGEVVHLFVGVRGGFDEAPLQHGPYRAQIGAFATVTWLHGDVVLMVASRLPAVQLERMLHAERLALAGSGRDLRAG